MIKFAKNLDLLHESFVKSKPFHHVVIDNAFDEKVLNEMLQNFPSKDEKKWWIYNNVLEKKLAYNNISELHPSFREYFSYINSSAFLKMLEEICGIEDLIADVDLNGGGLHQILNGGKLDIHEDFNIHKGLNSFRKVNAILYLNKDWHNEYGGHLELWNQDMTECVHKIAPIFNRLVIFRTDMSSNHGHPHPLTCPENMSRKSLATYYYLKCNDEEVPYTSTKYKKLPHVIEDPSVEELRIKRSKGRVES